MALTGHARQSKQTKPSTLPSQDGVVHITLLELVRTVGEITEDEAEIVATVIQMLRSGRVKLAGNFRNEPAWRFAVD